MLQSFRMYAEKKHFFAAAIAAAKKCKKQTRMNAEQRILNAEQRILNACSKVRFSKTQVFYPGSFLPKFFYRGENFKRPKNREDSSDLDENLLDRIAAMSSMILKSFPRHTGSKNTFSKICLRQLVGNA